MHVRSIKKETKITLVLPEPTPLRPLHIQGNNFTINVIAKLFYKKSINTYLRVLRDFLVHIRNTVGIKMLEPHLKINRKLDYAEFLRIIITQNSYN